MISIRFHGRGGQGAVVASKLLAAAAFRDGWFVQAFPSFGAERSGAPVTAFLRLDQARITTHYQVYEPDHVVVLDPVLLKTVNVTAGMRPGGWLIVNSPLAPIALRLPETFNVATCDATGIALQLSLGSRTTPIVNTPMAGAFAATTRLVQLDSLIAAIPDVVPAEVEANQAGARAAFSAVQVRAAREGAAVAPGGRP
jgi:pyruvate ferredoxin oxidoreductase gamma subunit/2-oxoisovalerate ferredoxin oxidoreductase gamma subunit